LTTTENVAINFKMLKETIVVWTNAIGNRDRRRIGRVLGLERVHGLALMIGHELALPRALMTGNAVTTTKLVKTKDSTKTGNGGARDRNAAGFITARKATNTGKRTKTATIRRPGRKKSIPLLRNWPARKRDWDCRKPGEPHLPPELRRRAKRRGRRRRVATKIFQNTICTPMRGAMGRYLQID